MWSMGRTLAVIAIVLGSAPGAAFAATGLHGVVFRGPITPVCRAGTSCDAPAPAVTLTFTRAGVARSTRTDAHGAYRIALPAGIYAVHTSSKPFGQTPRPANVHVRAGHLDSLDFTIDTGIR